MLLFLCGVGKTVSLCIDIVLIFCHILVLREYWVLTKSRIPLKPGLRIAVLLLVLMNRLIKTESVVSYIVGSLYFGKIRFYRII